MIPKDYGIAPGVHLKDPFGTLCIDRSRCERPILLEQVNLLGEVVQVIVPLEHPGGVPLCLLFVGDVLEGLDEGRHAGAAQGAIAHQG